MTTISLVGTASFLPETVRDNAFFQRDGEDGAAHGPMFRGSRLRHHLADGDTAADMIARAARSLGDKLNLDLTRDVDLILTNVSCPDIPFTGSGAIVSRALGCQPMFILDLHNTGCISFVFMMSVARSLMTTMGARTALLCNVQSSAGRVFAHPDNRYLPQSAVPGDGCGVGFLVANAESPVRAIATRSYGEFSEDMQVTSDDGGAWWAPRSTPLHIDFTESRVATIVSRGNALVPRIIREACTAAELDVGDVDVLVTNQPNPVFLRNWRESLQLPPEAHVHTFEEHGNLFGAAIPISLERAEQTGKLIAGANVVIGGFSHAGDYAGAAVVTWRPT